LTQPQRESLGGESNEELVLYLHHDTPTEPFLLAFQQKKSFYKISDDLIGLTFNSYKHNILSRELPLIELN
jgi:hypothetical protein